tara:strand:- start:5048 stop:6703 length:1656 start_codon:yes stop_codon:yes gene_type:complete
MAGRVQLATKGSQDAFFTDNPDYSHFLRSFRKHSNFAMFDVKHELHGKQDYESTLKCTIPINCGDLIKGVRLHIELSDLLHDGVYQKYNESIGHAIIEYVDLIIGGQLIQRVPRDWLQIYSEQYLTQTKQNNLSKLIGKSPEESSGKAVSDPSIDGYLDKATTSQKFIVDIPFYFHNNMELALPLCALKQQECEIEIKLSEKKDCLYKWSSMTNTTTRSSDNTTFNVTVSNGVFDIDNNPQPTLTLQRGRTYIFDYSSAGHPFKLSKIADGRTAQGFVDSGSILGASDGVTENASVITYVVPDNAPDTIYYYCNNPSHVGMGGTINILEPYLDPSKATINDVSLYTEMAQLNDPEKGKLEAVKTDYIITQLQSASFQIPASAQDGYDSMKFRMEFINPVKELYFVIARKGEDITPFNYDHSSQIYPSSGSNKKYINYENLVTLEMELDREVILDEQSGDVINLRAVQSGIHHSRTQLFRRFYSYSFALEPEKWYPTGQKNFSLIKDQHVTLKLNNDTTYERELRVYALSNNILQFADGSARLLFNSGEIGN